jgi:predicted nucleic acid-binding protein
LLDVAKAVLLRALLKEIEFHAPVILKYEMGNVLTKAKRQPRRPMDSKKAVSAYNAFSDLVISYYDLDKKARLQAVEFSNTHHRNYYDSTYICLAMNLGIPWLTAEKRYITLPPAFPKEYIVTLESFE